MSSESSLPSAARKNIDIIAGVERELLRKQSVIERLGQAVARFFGSLLFIFAHALVFGGWIVWNSGLFPALHRFDPYPFPFLSLVIGIEFIFLTTFVLMNQKYQIRRSEQWSHLHLQLSMLTEQEVTKNLELLGAVSRRLGLDTHETDKELSELARPTSVEAFVGEIEKVRDPAEPPPSGKQQVMEMEQALANEPAPPA